MKLILVIMGSREGTNFFKLVEASKQLGKRNTILVSGTLIKCVFARIILRGLGIKQSRVLLDIKSKDTRRFVKEYMSDYEELILISEHHMEERLIRSMYKGKLSIVRI